MIREGWALNVKEKEVEDEDLGREGGEDSRRTGGSDNGSPGGGTTPTGPLCDGVSGPNPPGSRDRSKERVDNVSVFGLPRYLGVLE